MTGVTMQKVAKRAGVSRAAVSFVLNGKYENRVKPHKVSAIMKACEELDYHPNASGRSLAMRKTRTIGVALYEIDYITARPYFAMIIGGMEEVMGGHDYNLLLTTTRRTDRKHNQNLFFLTKVKERRLDGLVVIDQLVEDEDIAALERLEVPYVLVDRRAPGARANCVLIDHRDAMCQATEHLIAMGHRRIGFLHSPYYSGEEQLAGYELALMKNGLGYDPDLVFKMECAERVVELALSKLLALSSPPSAILSSEDEQSVETMNILRARGLRVPEDMAVVGFNDVAIARLAYPPLTTVRAPLKQMGEKAMELLVKLLNGEKAEPAEIVLKADLVVRQSCGAGMPLHSASFGELG